MRKYQYFSGRKQDFTFWSSNMTSQKEEHPQPKGQKESLDKLSSTVFGQGLVGECLEHEKPQQAIDPFFS
jgi:hypothetical protein|tara:strand:+ start:1250 stop:1459 length:210 start_codon:yes stop_codon:yes gene_type:complete